MLISHPAPPNHQTTPPPQRTTNEDLTHLRAQTITVEVNMARLFNWNVQNKKLGAAGAGATPKFREVST